MKGKIKILKLNKDDLEVFKELIELLNEVFEEYNSIASEAHLERLLSKPDFYAIVAIQNHKVVAGLTGYELQRYYNNQNEIYIYDIAVKTSLQNQGIGKQLIEFLKAQGIKNNVATIFVEAHSEDIQAVKFYESTFGASEKVDHFNLNLG